MTEDITRGGLGSTAVKVRVEPLKVSPKSKISTLVDVPQPAVSGIPAGLTVVGAPKAGEVSWLDKMKAYYHTIITVVGLLLALATAIGGAEAGLPASWQKAFIGVIGFLTVASNALKSNEIWVQKL